MRERKIVPLDELPEELQMTFKLDTSEITKEEWDAWDYGKWLEAEKIRRGKAKKYEQQGRCRVISDRLRSRLRNALKAQGASKTSRTFSLIGCSPDELRDWIEFQFEEGMSWGNRSQWHIDHIKPCSAFDLTDEQQQQECFHWSNLQPLWAVDNLRKRDKWEED